MPVKRAVADILLTSSTHVSPSPGLPCPFPACSSLPCTFVAPCVVQVLGCTSKRAINFQPRATVADGSCLLAGCTNSAAANFEREVRCSMALQHCRHRIHRFCDTGTSLRVSVQKWVPHILPVTRLFQVETGSMCEGHFACLAFSTTEAGYLFT